MARLINPATDKPFVSVEPSREIVKLREQIISQIRASYDAAQTTMQNEKHWAPSNNLSPNSVNSLSIRKTLRQRSRYETSNSGYLKGIILSLCQDMVGSGPTLQITDPRFQLPNGSSETESPASIIERRWKQRAKKIKLRKKLWKLQHAKRQDGEGFAVSFNNRDLKHSVTIDQRIFECDQFSHFDFTIQNKNSRYNEIDGIRFSKSTGNPKYYHLLYSHPGETEIINFNRSVQNQGRWINADDVIHWFRQDRDWLRGIPETTTTLPLWALLRRYTLAVVQNAEIAADFTILLKTLKMPYATGFDINSSTGEPTQTNEELWFQGFPIDRGMITAMPDGYDVNQLKPEQPVTVYDSFVAALVGEASRPLLTPRNTAMLDSGNHNMSAGVHDTQTYRNAIKQERLDCEEEVLDKDLDQWWFEAIRTPNYFGETFVNDPVTRIVQKFADLREDPPEHTFRWDEVPEHTDPYKVAQAIDLMYQAGHITDVDIQEGRMNRSVESHHENRKRQLAREEELRENYPNMFMSNAQESNDGENEDFNED